MNRGHCANHTTLHRPHLTLSWIGGSSARGDPVLVEVRGWGMVTGMGMAMSVLKLDVTMLKMVIKHGGVDGDGD